jgi:hypothetical protein
MKAGRKRKDRKYFENVYYDAWYGSFFKGRKDTIHHVTHFHACADDYRGPGPDRYHDERWVHVYYLRMVHGTGQWTNLAGHKLDTPLSREEADRHCRVFTSDPCKGHLKLIATRVQGFDVGPEGRPHILFCRGRGRSGRLERKWTLAVGDPKSGKWTLRDIPHGGRLTVRPNGSLKVWANRVAVSEDGPEKWSVTDTLRDQGLRGCSLAYDGRPEARLVGWDEGEDVRARRIFLWGSKGFITAGARGR